MTSQPQWYSPPMQSGKRLGHSLPLPLPLPFLPFLPFSFYFLFFSFTFPPSLSSPIPDIQGDLSQPGMVLQGQVDRGRFGNSVTNLGDIDDDGYEGMHVCGVWQWGEE